MIQPHLDAISDLSYVRPGDIGPYGPATTNFYWSNQDEPSFKEIDVAETEELAENNPGESVEVVQMH